MLKKGLIGMIALAFVLGIPLSAKAFKKDEFTRKWECVSHLQDQGYSFPDAYRKCVIMLEREKASKVSHERNFFSRGHARENPSSTKAVQEQQLSHQNQHQPQTEDLADLPAGL